MSTQYTANAGIPYSQLDDLNWYLPIQQAAALLDTLNSIGDLAVSPTAPGSSSPLPSTTLGVNVAAGIFLSATGSLVTYAGGSLTLSASTTTYLWLTDSGSLASGASFPSSTQMVPLATVTTGSSTVTAITDSRVIYRSYGGSASGYILKAGDTLGDGSNFVLGTTTGTRLGTGTAQKLAFFGATPIVQPAAGTDLLAALVSLGLIGTGSPTPLNLSGGVLQGGVQLPVTTVSASLALSTLGLFVVSAASSITITLPAASTNTGGVIVIKRIDATGNTVTVSRAGSDTIDGATTDSTLASQWTVLRLVASSSAWLKF